MNNFSCTIWQFIAFGFTCLCGGISLGVTIGKDIWKREIDELKNRLIKREVDELNDRLMFKENDKE